MSDDAAAGRLDPAAVVVEETAGADGADDASGGGRGVTGIFDDAVKRAAHGASAKVIETEGDGVTANGVRRGEPKIESDVA